MAYLREFPISRIPPYEVEPFDLAPVPRPDPYQLDEAGVRSAPLTFGAFMLPRDLQHFHRVQSRSASAPQSGWLKGLPDPTLGFMENPVSPYRPQPGAAVPGVDPKTGLKVGQPLPGTDHERPHPNFTYGSLRDHLLRDPELARYLGEAREEDIRDLFIEFLRGFMPNRPTAATEQWQKPAPSPDPRRQPQLGPVKLRGAPPSQAQDSRVVLNGQGGGGPGFGANTESGVQIGQGSRQVGVSVGNSLSHGGKPPKTSFTIDDFKILLKTPAGRAELYRRFGDNGFGGQVVMPF